MKTIDSEELKLIQVKILDDIDAFCKKHDIKYSISYGTLIGAVRHKGYIPWDDDIDIIMPRPDYEKFTKLYKSSDYEFLECSITPGYLYAFGKVIDRSTLLIEPNKYNYSDMGVYVDVFPVDGLPQDKSERERHLKRANGLAHIVTLKSLNSKYPMGVAQRMKYIVLQAVLSVIPMSRFVSWQNRIAQRYPFDTSEFVSVLTTRHISSSGLIKKSYFNSYVDLEFEKRSYRSIAGYDEYLTTIYGDYMKLPPEEKRNTHHYFEAYYKNI